MNCQWALKCRTDFFFQELAEDISDVKSKIINKEVFLNSAKKIQSKIQDEIDNIKHRYAEAIRPIKAYSKISLTSIKRVCDNLMIKTGNIVLVFLLSTFSKLTVSMSSLIA